MRTGGEHEQVGALGGMGWGRSARKAAWKSTLEGSGTIAQSLDCMEQAAVLQSSAIRSGFRNRCQVLYISQAIWAEAREIPCPLWLSRLPVHCEIGQFVVLNADSWSQNLCSDSKSPNFHTVFMHGLALVSLKVVVSEIEEI